MEGPSAMFRCLMTRDLLRTIYRAIQSSSMTFRSSVGGSFGAKKCKYLFGFAAVSELRHFLLLCSLYYCNCGFLRNGSSFGTSQLISLSAVKERESRFCPLHSSSHQSRLLLFTAYPFVWWGPVRLVTGAAVQV